MPVTFDPALADLIGTGHAARTLLFAQEKFCGALVEETLKELDRQVTAATLTPERAYALTYEIAAYRRIVARLRSRVVAGEHAEARQAARHQESHT